MEDQEVIDSSLSVVDAGLRIIDRDLYLGRNGLPWPEDTPEYQYLNGAKEGLLRVKEKLEKRARKLRKV